MTTRFDDWSVDCNECRHYWDDSCSGAGKGTIKGCRDYQATRSIVIPEQIKKLEESVSNLKLNVRILWMVLLLVIFGILLWRWLGA